MKIAGYYHKKGDRVCINDFNNPDKIFLSVIFERNLPKALGLCTMFENFTLLGGTGFSHESKLPPIVEHTKPYYDLFGCTASIGFTSRGCFRNCGFCIVPEKEGRKIVEWSPFEEFIDERFNHVILFDPNFLGSPKSLEKLEYIIDQGFTVNFSQGLDLRLITEENAKLLSEVKARNYKNNAIQYYFAWDNIDDEKSILSGLNLLKESGIKPYYCMVFVLVGFNTSYEEDLYRVQKLIEFGVQPYVMRFNGSKDEFLKDLARWVNGRHWKSCSFEDYLPYYQREGIV